MNSIKIFRFTILFLFFSIYSSVAQDFHFDRKIDPFEVLDENGSIVEFPFLGGFNGPRFQFLDIDGDSDADLFIQEEIGPISYFENTDSAQQFKFEWRTDNYQNVKVGAWFIFRDMDQDGDFDLFGESKFSQIRYFINTGTAGLPRFEVIVDTLRDMDSNIIFAERTNYPELADIDCDSDFDLFLGNTDGSISFYKNIGLNEEDVPIFKLITNRFQDLLIITPGGGATIPKINTQDNSSKHGANALIFNDIDNDSDMDLFWGDFFSSTVLFFENNGSCQAPKIDSTHVSFPLDFSIQTGGFNMPRFVDLDNDGDDELFVGILGGFSALAKEKVNNFYYYLNMGSPELPEYSLESARFIESIDIGDRSIPALVDIDADGDLDLFVGNESDPTDFLNSHLYFYENQGTQTTPAFKLVDTNYMNLEIGFNYAPTFVDIDADGDYDLYLGEWNGKLNYFKNQGTHQDANFILVDQDVAAIDVGNNSTPAFLDIDVDGDFDLFIGELSGNIDFYENIGTANNPEFQLDTTHFDGIDVGTYSVPAFADLDKDQDIDLLIGSEDSGFHFFRNIGDASNPQFIADTSLTLFSKRYSSPALGDLDNDQDLDIISGSLGGGLLFFENRTITTSIIDQTILKLPKDFRLYQNYPNPFNPVTTIQFDIIKDGQASLAVFNSKGSEIRRLIEKDLKAGFHSVRFFTEFLPSGIYFYRIQVRNSSNEVFEQTKKMLLIK